MRMPLKMTVRRFGLVGLIAVCWFVGDGQPAAAQDPPGFAGSMTRRPPPDFSDRTVEFTTADGVIIKADFYPSKPANGATTPIAILIHMYPADRSSWKSFATELRKQGFSVLAYDIRGQGGSTAPKDRKLAEAYKERSTVHFQSASMDVLGAMSWLAQQEFVDSQRFVLVGASIGCSISLNTATQAGDCKGVVCLSPGENYMGLDSLQQIKNVAPYVPTLLISPEGEYGSIEKLLEACDNKAKGLKFPGGPEYHGTKMFDAPYGGEVQSKVIDFLCKGVGIEVKKEKESDDKPKVDGDKDGKKSGDSKKKKSKKKNSRKKTGGKKAKKPVESGDDD